MAYKLLRIPDDKADKSQPAVKEMLDLRKALNIPVTAGDLEKTAKNTQPPMSVVDAILNSAPAREVVR